MGIAKLHNFPKLQFDNSLLTTLSYYNPITTTGTSSISLRAPQEKLTDPQLHSRRTKAFKQIQAEQQSVTIKRTPEPYHQADAREKGASALHEANYRASRWSAKYFRPSIKIRGLFDLRTKLATPTVHSLIDQGQQGFHQDQRKKELIQFYEDLESQASPSVSEGLLADHRNCGPSLDVLILDTVKVSR
jgi:hypothetical protein